MVTNAKVKQSFGTVPVVAPESEWYALYTRPRQEMPIAARLAERGVETYLPVVTEVHRSSDRKKSVQLPLLSCYVFGKFIPDRSERLRVLSVIRGVLGLVGSRGEGAPIPREQVDAVHTLVEGTLPWSFHSFIKLGQRVRIRIGALNGVEGVLLSRNDSLNTNRETTRACNFTLFSLAND